MGDDEGEGEGDHKPPEFYSVAVYLTVRAFGGREEGRWRYDYGLLAGEWEFAQLTRYFRDVEEAYAYARELNERKEEWNEGRREPSSVLSNGHYEALVMDGHPPAYWPEERPRYE